VAASFVPELKLSGALKLRADAEQTGFANIDALIADAVAHNRSGEFSEDELESWIVRLSFGNKSKRALKVSKLYTALFPKSNRALELLASSYEANAQRDEARRTYEELISRDHDNSAARAYLKKKMTTVAGDD
jgi:DNA-binding transcriptional regulator YbjK